MNLAQVGKSARERICGGSPITFYSASLATKSEFSSSVITIDIHLLAPGVDRSMAELEQCSLEWSWLRLADDLTTAWNND